MSSSIYPSGSQWLSGLFWYPPHLVFAFEASYLEHYREHSGRDGGRTEEGGPSSGVLLDLLVPHLQLGQWSTHTSPTGQQKKLAKKEGPGWFLKIRNWSAFHGLLGIYLFLEVAFLISTSRTLALLLSRSPKQRSVAIHTFVPWGASSVTFERCKMTDCCQKSNRWGLHGTCLSVLPQAIGET